MENRFERVNGVSMRFFMWTMFAMAIIGFAFAYLS